MSSGIERQIFEDASRPEPEVDDVDAAVSRSISALQTPEDHEEPPAPQPQQRPAGPDPLAGVDDRSNSGLLRALLDERERRQDAARQLERYQAREREQSRTEGKQPISERLFVDPENTLNELRQEWTAPLMEQLSQMQLNNDFERAKGRHGEKFDKAWEAWYAACDGGKDAQSYFQVMNAPSPGEAMVRWHRMRLIAEEMGDDDLDAYKQRLIAEGGSGRSEPRARAADGTFTARPQAQPRLPTATSRMGRSRRDEDDDQNDGSDEAIFAAARPSRRGER